MSNWAISNDLYRAFNEHREANEKAIEEAINLASERVSINVLVTNCSHQQEKLAA